MKILNEKLPSKSNLVQLFSLFFVTFKHLSHVLTLPTLSSFYINGLEEGCAHLPEILTSTYGIKLKLVPVIALNKRRQYMTLSPRMLFWTQCKKGFDPSFLSDPPFWHSYFSGKIDPPLIRLKRVVILGCFHITPRV